MKDVGFVHDLASLDRLRLASQTGDDNESALRAAAQQFEGIFTQMVFRAMRQANNAFRSDLMSSQTLDFYQQLYDEQLSNQLSQQSQLGLADLLVKQFSSTDVPNFSPKTDAFEREAFANPFASRLPLSDPDLEKAASLISELPKIFQSPMSFIEALLPQARQAADRLNVDPQLLLAQSALETGWGKKVLSKGEDHSFNLFNIKADPSWQGKKLGKRALEFEQGQALQVHSAFRQYDSYRESFEDFVNFLQLQPRYQSALKQAPDNWAFLQGLHRAGYATDPHYAEKVWRVYQQIKSNNVVN